MEKLYSLSPKAIVQAIRSEGWAFIFICLYLFFEYVRPQSIYPVIDIIPWVPFILTCATVSLLLGGEIKKRPNILNKLIVLYGLIVILSSIFSQYPSISFLKWRSFFDWFIIYFLIIIIVNNEKRFFVFLLFFLLFSFKMSQHGFLSWMKRGFAFTSWGVTGAPGWFQNSGEAGIQMCIYVPLSIAFIFATYKCLSKPKLFFFLLMPFTGIATVIATSSRGALVGLAAAGIRPLLIRPLVFIKGTIILSLLCVVIIYATPEEFKQRIENSGSDRTSLHRLERWKHGIDAMGKFPLLGIGFEVWSEYYPSHYEMEDEGTLLVHNIFVQCGSELGYSGLIVFLFIIYACFLNTRSIRKLSRNHYDRFFAIMSYGLDAALLGFIASGFFVTVLYYPYFWIHCALTTCLRTVVCNKFDNVADRRLSTSNNM